MYPIKFENLYYDKIWGGRDLELFRTNLPEGNIGESWDIACHPNGTGKISNGKFKGMSFNELIESYKDEVLGKEIDEKRFPLLIKIINANDKLSVQVHPNDEYGFRMENEPGKTEIWYVVEALEGANLVVGTKDCTREKFIEALDKGELDKYLNKVPVKKGEVYFVKSGLVHAIGEGVIIAEIQQNSDTTYRVYDYNRGRDLHVDKALDVIDFSLKGEKSLGIKVEKVGYTKTYYALCEHFSLEEYNIEEKLEETSDKERFFVLTCVEGEGKILYKDGIEEIEKGDSVLIPANLGRYTILGRLKLLKSYVPNVAKVEKEILEEIKK
ncbi:type I phosphomannose isomerase catalytic subunit [Clostridium hydrogeniformans]|uniref:type I phosphomannose isomerase catalytic subunit n=1 Tax=Clostridium hydrogeniformans TaxID=349933 RepID=UPI0004873FC1|nr:type I phosphomannose isomerase catalytic subunit [Clostridium hydrogeniformans]